MFSTGFWMMQIHCADAWNVELPLVLPEGLILDQDLALFGISVFLATGQSLNQL